MAVTPLPYIVLDFEAYYDKEYSLKKITPVEYILDERWECLGCSIIEGPKGYPVWRDGDDLKAYFRGLRDRQRAGEKITCMSHNALFDMCVLAWRFGFVPDMMIDTMSMARATIKAKIRNGSVALAQVAKFLGIGVKGDTIKRVIGMRRADIEAAGLWRAYTQYAGNDAVLCRDIFEKLKHVFPRSEYAVMNLVIRMAVMPRFQLDTDLIADHLAEVRAAKEQLLQRVGLVTKEDLMSNEKFAQALLCLGVDPPKKVSLKTGQMTWAFAKTDHDFAMLEESDDEDVAALVSARLGVKSTLEETRAERFLSISQLRWPGNFGVGWMPIPLAYSGAHTHRLSGDWKLNGQNLRRGGNLRKSLKAPHRHKVVTCDSSQIEARIVATLAGQDDLVAVFERGEDVYCTFGSQHIYKRTITKADIAERFCSKQAVLGLGFGMGDAKYVTQVKKDSRLQLKGPDGRPLIIELSPLEGKQIVQGYRGGYSKIPQAWRFCESMLPRMSADRNLDVEWGPIRFQYQSILLPNGHRLFYHNLRQEHGPRGLQWVFDYGRERKTLFGGKVYENIVQALARIINLDSAIAMYKMFPRWPLAHQVHDELIFVVPDEALGEFVPALEATMRVRPKWLPNLPLDCESGVGQNYGEAK